MNTLLNMIRFNDFDWVGQTPSKDNPFQSLIDVVQDTGNSVYALLLSVGVVLLLISVVVTAIRIGIDRKNRETVKIDILYVILFAIMLFSAVGIVTAFVHIGTTINDEIKNGVTDSAVAFIRSLALIGRGMLL